MAGQSLLKSTKRFLDSIQFVLTAIFVAASKHMEMQSVQQVVVNLNRETPGYVESFMCFGLTDL